MLVAADRSDRREAGLVSVTTAPVVAQTSRSPRPAQLRQLLRGCDVVASDAADAPT